MTPSIIPIGGSQLDWQAFLSASQQALGYSTLRGVDNIRRELSDPAKFIAAVAAFHGKQATDNPISAIQNASTLLRHLHYTFMIHCEERLLSYIRERTDLTITSAVSQDEERVAIVSGNLQQYRDGAIECCVQDAHRDVRLLFNGFVLYFERLGLHELWAGYSKRMLDDLTLLLEYKP